MNYILDITGSYIIGGLILVALVGLTLQFSSETQETKLVEITQRSLNDVGSVLEYDFNKIGYRIEDDDKILGFSSNSISFLADLDNNGVIDTVSYSTYQADGKNYLKRRVGYPQNIEWAIPVLAITLTGFDNLNNTTSTIDEIKSIAFQIELESDNYDQNIEIQGASWKKQFFPKNL